MRATRNLRFSSRAASSDTFAAASCPSISFRRRSSCDGASSPPPDDASVRAESGGRPDSGIRGDCSRALADSPPMLLLARLRAEKPPPVPLGVRRYGSKWPPPGDTLADMDPRFVDDASMSSSSAPCRCFASASASSSSWHRSAYRSACERVSCRRSTTSCRSSRNSSFCVSKKSLTAALHRSWIAKPAIAKARKSCASSSCAAVCSHWRLSASRSISVRMSVRRCSTPCDCCASAMDVEAFVALSSAALMRPYSS
mmetsp:Transcript_42179/g.130279  ORF Transcript_42179/g.130279 Transcript_42179/m.130279 type:complete len:256 (-) Transcript_42179:821-1588(-)